MVPKMFEPLKFDCIIKQSKFDTLKWSYWSIHFRLLRRHTVLFRHISVDHPYICFQLYSGNSRRLDMALQITVSNRYGPGWNYPSGHMAFMQRRINVDATWCCINGMCLWDSIIYIHNNCFEHDTKQRYLKDVDYLRHLIRQLYTRINLYTVFVLITAHTPISAQSSSSVVFRLQPV